MAIGVSAGIEPGDALRLAKYQERSRKIPGAVEFARVQLGLGPDDRKQFEERLGARPGGPER
jgi:hypothetical protein